MKITERITRLRELMKAEGIQAYLIPSADAHNNEYVPECWKRRQFISGFTGSAGDVVIAHDEGGLWTDGRYFLQAEDQLKGTGIDLYKKDQPGVPAMEKWLADKLADGGVLGVDPRTMCVKNASKLEKELAAQEASIQYIESNLVDQVWDDQPTMEFSPLDILPEAVAGQTVKEKLEAVREKMAAKHCDAHLVCSLDAIAWLYNLRAADIAYNRLFLAYAAITADGAHLFIDSSRISDDLQEHLKGLAEIHPYEEIGEFVQDLSDSRSRLWMDPENTNKWLEILIGDKIKLHSDRSPVTDLKAVKNTIELEGFRNCHLADGVAMVRFFKWLEEAVPEGGITEISASAKLAEFREQDQGYIGPSFPTIAGYGAHGAIIHYEASSSSDVELKPGGIFLVDSGGHYRTGTTDITRTLAIGEPTAEQREVFTCVLKGMIGLTMIKFPKGYNGKSLEFPARKALWDHGRNFNHGTGHGVGHSLNVHEGPVYFSPRAPEVPLEPGNVLSNEPGFYKTGEFGIRIENLMIVQKCGELSSDGQLEFLEFETITLCPIELELIDPGLLTEEELDWLNRYHRRVYEQLSENLDREHREWLQKKTREIKMESEAPFTAGNPALI
jgi:Xaa-Pro aminopeptidase